MKHKDLAKQAGFHIASSNLADIGWVWCSDGYPIDEQLERFAELVRANECEACASLCYSEGKVRLAETIRARGNK